MAEPAESILVVDDNEANRDTLQRRLKRQGYDARTATDGIDALTQISQFPFDLIILDVMMPGMSGLDVVREIRKTQGPAQLPVIMATARDQSEDVVQALRLGASDYITKPLDFDVALARVRTQLELKRSVTQVLNLERRLSDRNAELEAANERLRRAADQTRQDLESAAKVQAALLPSSPPRFDGANFAWAFEPCQQLAGDSLNILKLDERNVAFYVLDVSGHGVAASLLAVAATRLLSVERGSTSILLARDDNDEPYPASPDKVVRDLDTQLPPNEETLQFLTFVYGLYNGKTRQLSYCSAGHPPLLHLPANGSPKFLDGAGVPVGVGIADEPYLAKTIGLNPGDRIFAYSDGVTETMSPARSLFGSDRLLEIVQRGASLSLTASIDLLLKELLHYRGDAHSKDDVSIVAMQCT